MESRVSIDQVPQVARPAAVTVALEDAAGLRDRFRRSQEELAEREAELRQLEQDDVAKAAERARKGAALGAVAPGVEKAKAALEVARRNASALGVAATSSQDDLVDQLAAGAEGWIEALDAEAERARERATDALGELEQALADLTRASSAGIWIRSAVTDGRWDRAVPLSSAGQAAQSSARMSANGAPLDRGMLLGFCRELIAPPAPAAPTPDPVHADLA